MAATGEATAIQNLLYQSYSENLHKAIALVMGEPKPGGDFFDLTLQFKANTSRFAAYKATQAADAIMQAADNPTQIKALLNTFNRYQAAEYQITLMRAQTARQFALFTKDTARNKILPNIKWLPSVSKDKRKEHKEFYHKVFAKNDPFWNTNHPGNLWGCKCDWIETNEPTEAQKGEPTPPAPKPAPGLENNPQDGRIFSDEASYIAKAGRNGAERERAEKRCEGAGRNYTVIANKNLLAQTTTCNVKGDILSVGFIEKGIEEYAQSMWGNKKLFWLKNEILKDMPDYIAKAEYKGYKEVDLTHNTRQATIDFKAKLDYYLYFESKLPNGTSICLQIIRFRADKEMALYTITKNVPEDIINKKVP
jgi:hypothetical protein